MSFRCLLMMLLAMAGIVFAPISRGAGKSPGFHLEPNLISMGASYNGARASISGDMPDTSEVVVCVSQKARDFDFFQKGHVLNLFWMNVGEITVNNVPAVYMLHLPHGISVSDVVQKATQKGLIIGYDALEKQASITPDDGDSASKFKEFIKFKESKGLYAIHPDSVTYTSFEQAPHRKTFSCDLTIPSEMEQGTYRVTTYVFDEDGTVRTDERNLKIEETGLPAMVVSLAFDHGSIYGVVSAIIAILAGLLMGVIFKGGKGAH